MLLTLSCAHPVPEVWAFDLGMSESAQAHCRLASGGITCLGRSHGTRVSVSLGSPKHRTPTYPLICRGGGFAAMTWRGRKRPFKSACFPGKGLQISCLGDMKFCCFIFKSTVGLRFWSCVRVGGGSIFFVLF